MVVGKKKRRRREEKKGTEPKRRNCEKRCFLSFYMTSLQSKPVQKNSIQPQIHYCISAGTVVPYEGSGTFKERPQDRKEEKD